MPRASLEPHNYHFEHPLGKIERDRQVISELSVWSDQVWRFPSLTAGRGIEAISWRAINSRIEDDPDIGDETKAELRLLVDMAKRLLWSVWSRNARTAQIKSATLASMATGLKHLLNWMINEGYSKFEMITPEVAEYFVKDYFDARVRDVIEDEYWNLKSGDAVVYEDQADDEDNGEQSVSTRSIAQTLDILARIYEQRHDLQSVDGAVMPNHPYGGLSAFARAKLLQKDTSKSTPPIHDKLFLEVTQKAIEWLGAPARDITKLLNHHVNEFTQYASDFAYLGIEGEIDEAWVQRSEQEIRRFVFDDDSRLPTPWREPIDPLDHGVLYEFLNKSIEPKPVVWSASRQLCELALDLQSACSILVQALVGIRLSEVCGLRALPYDDNTDLPYCIEIQKSISGEMELFFVRGNIYKGNEGAMETRWIAGARPSGSTELPIAIKAILCVASLFENIRELNGEANLFVSLHETAGFKYVDACPVRGNDIALGQKRFIYQWVHEPVDEPYQNITTHQWRKTFALHVVRADERLLPALADHFHHVNSAITDLKYVGNDTQMLGILQDIGAYEAARLITDAIDGKESFTGKLAMSLERRRTNVLKSFLRRGSRESRIEGLSQALQDENVKLRPAPWGTCIFRAETARCHGDDGGPSGAETPNYAIRQSGVCYDCGNLIAGPEHIGYWQRRYDDERAMLEQNLAAGETQTAAAIARKLELSLAMLKRLQVAPAGPREDDLDAA